MKSLLPYILTLTCCTYASADNHGSDAPSLTRSEDAATLMPLSAYQDVIDSPGFSFDVTPIGLTSKETKKESIGASYLLQYTDKGLDMEDSFGEDTELSTYPKAVGYQVDAGVRGTLTESSTDNPLNFQEAHTSLEMQYLTREMYSAGGYIKYEADQGFDNRQVVFGGKVRFGRSENLPTLRDLLVVVLRYGRVNPEKDTEREAVLGAALDNYNRAELEAHWQINLSGAGPDGFQFSSFEANYRYFQEINPDDRVKETGIDDFRLLTFLLRLNKDWSIAYSSGEFPFNLRDDRIFQLGYTFEFK
ncbi:hypothetical protein [Marinobacter sp.]|uniref:hypothetical protein n=1 Tax=Marinobacter sp. TaxID=50741 RepID=UPI002355A54E|nr:hypothetical protein [Marinobacter sp.]